MSSGASPSQEGLSVKTQLAVNMLSLYNVPETNLSTVDEEMKTESMRGENMLNLGLEWEDGVAQLPGSSLQFRMSENGDVEVIDERKTDFSGDLLKTDSHDSNACDKPVTEITTTEMDLDTNSSEKAAKNFPKTERTLQPSQNISSKLSASARRKVVQKGKKSLRDNPQEETSNMLQKCNFCGKEGTSKSFFGKFCSRVCIGRNAGKRKYSRILCSTSNSLTKKAYNKATIHDASPFLHGKKLRGRMQLPSTSQAKLKRCYSKKKPLPSLDSFSDTLPSSRQDLFETLQTHNMARIFNWNSYLFATQSLGLLPEQYEAITGRSGFPLKENPFEEGWFLEAVDPMHQSLICLASIAQVQGYRLRLHFVDFPECFDFWVNADSPFLFPCGFCEQTGRQLSLPHDSSMSSMDFYTKNLSSVLPPASTFSEAIYTNKTTFKVGDKLEAVDRKNVDRTCVATVIDAIDGYVMIHLDGWENDHDYWASSSSAFIHPVGWCQENGKQIAPPLEHDLTKPFDWSDYMRETKSVAAEPSCFVKSERKFEVDMKIEVVDQRNPILIRVATITEVNDLRIKIHFDGWSDDFDDWLDVDNMDIHPINWCSKTSHPLQPPVDMTSKFKKSCPVEGCNALGHANTPKDVTYHKRHFSEHGCPYSRENLNKRGTYNRFSVQSSFQEDGDQWRGNSSLHFAKRRRGGKRRRASRTVFQTLHKEQKQESRRVEHPLLSSSTYSKHNRFHSKDENFYVSSKSLHDFNKQQVLMQCELLNERFLKSSLIGSLSLLSSAHLPQYWDENVKRLPGVNEIKSSQVRKWSCAEVSEFVSNVTGKREYGDAFAREEVDGEALLLLTQSDISNALKLKLGPAVKIYNAVLFFKASIVDMKQ